MRYRGNPSDIRGFRSSYRLSIRPTYLVMATQAELDLLLQSPTIPPPPGVTPNLVNPPAYGVDEWTFSASVCLSVTTLIVAIRVYTRLCLSRTRLWEDCKGFLSRQIVSIPFLNFSQICPSWHGYALRNLARYNFTQEALMADT